MNPEMCNLIPKTWISKDNIVFVAYTKSQVQPWRLTLLFIKLQNLGVPLLLSFYSKNYIAGKQKDNTKSK